MRYRPRLLARTVRRALSTFPAVLVTGARQSGKTTLLREEFGKSHRYLSLERPDVRNAAVADPLGFFAESPPPLILDEIQYAPDLLHYVKERIDEERSPGNWLLSGSQSFSLVHGVSQSLAGRVAVLRLDPFSTPECFPGTEIAESTFSDLLDDVFTPTAKRSRRGVDLADWLLRGGYPEPRLHEAVDRQLWFSSYVQTYLERDVRDLVQVADLTTFSRFVALVAARTGSLLNLAELGREAGITAPTAKRWLSVLETSQLIYLLPPFHRNLGKRIRKSPKLYLMDPGLATFLLGLHSREAVLGGPTLGALAETAAITEWVKAARERGVEPRFSFWRPASGGEVDLIIEHDGRLFGLEIKATATPNPIHAEALARWLKLAGRGARGALACRIEQPRALRPGIRAVPWHLA